MVRLSLGKSFMVVGVSLLLFGLISIVNSPSAWATGVYYSQIPDNYAEQSCQLCHDSTMGFKDFALEFVDNNYSFTGLVPPPKADTTEAPVTAGEEEKQLAFLNLILPADAVRGEQIQLQAELQANGRALEGQQVQFFEKTNVFVGAEMMLLGEATTNQLGVATINYWPRATEDRVQILAIVAGDDIIAPVQTSDTLALVVTGPLVQPFNKLEIPFLGSWTIGLVVGAVWITFGYAFYNTLQIGKLSKTTEVSADRRREKHSA